MNKKHHNLKFDNRPQLPLRLSEEGWTLVELMMTIALIAIITPAITLLFAKVSQGMASDEMHSALQTGNQTMLNRIHVRMGGSKHFFFGDQSGVSFVNRLSIPSSPATVAGTTLPLLQAPVSGVFSLSVSWSGFSRANVGNALLFAAYDTPETIINAGSAPKIYLNSPMTVNCSNAVTGQDGSPKPVIIDLYRLYYYYLTKSAVKNLYDGQDYNLIEWQSIRFADYFQIQDYGSAGGGGDNILEANIMACLASQGISIAYDPSQSDPSQAFVSFGGVVGYGGSPGNAVALASYTIPMETTTNLTRVTAGILTNGFRYGICPNTNNWNKCPVQIPIFATVAAVGTEFPNGFEVAAGGNSSGREVMIRSVWVAEGGNGPRPIFNDINMVDYIRDIW